ncbi:hypothetical protein MKX03_008937 [Papaver bracteatum]|nr:hypothetical protein MKX03_008937 [Papaver bracteatum]
MVISDALNRCTNRAWIDLGEALRIRFMGKFSNSTNLLLDFVFKETMVTEQGPLMEIWERLYLHEDLIYFQSNLMKATLSPLSADPLEEEKLDNCREVICCAIIQMPSYNLKFILVNCETLFLM